MSERLTTIIKTLTSNDAGVTGTHQSGIVIPRTGSTLSFFPRLDTSQVNPRVELIGVDLKNDSTYPLNLIYYNGKIHGTSTRNEYRLTGITPYLKKQLALPGDQFQMDRVDEGTIELSLIKTSDTEHTESKRGKVEKIQLSGKWSTFKRKK